MTYKKYKNSYFDLCGVLALISLLGSISLLLGIIFYQEQDNKQLIYDLNVSQAALLNQKAKYAELNQQIAEGLCLPRLEM